MTKRKRSEPGRTRRIRQSLRPRSRWPPFTESVPWSIWPITLRALARRWFVRGARPTWVDQIQDWKKKLVAEAEHVFGRRGDRGGAFRAGDPAAPRQDWSADDGEGPFLSFKAKRSVETGERLEEEVGGGGRAAIEAAIQQLHAKIGQLTPKRSVETGERTPSDDSSRPPIGRHTTLRAARCGAFDRVLPAHRDLSGGPGPDAPLGRDPLRASV